MEKPPQGRPRTMFGSFPPQGTTSNTSGGGGGGDTSSNINQAQMLARVGHPAGTIESESGVTASVAQANMRRRGKTR